MQDGFQAARVGGTEKRLAVTNRGSILDSLFLYIPFLLKLITIQGSLLRTR